MFGQRVIDLVYMHNNELYCVEIKSSKDSLRKLSEQMTDMSSVSDYSIALLDSCHLAKARGEVSPKIGIITQDCHLFKTKRVAKRVNRKNKMHFCSLLNKDHLHKSLGEHSNAVALSCFVFVSPSIKTGLVR